MFCSLQVMDSMFYVRADFYGCVCARAYARFISVIHFILTKFGIADWPSLLRDFRSNPHLCSYKLNTQIKSAFLRFL